MGGLFALQGGHNDGMAWITPKHFETVGVWRWKQTDNGPELVLVPFHLNDDGIPVLDEPLRPTSSPQSDQPEPENPASQSPPVIPSHLLA